jgi:hypothetical protein
VGRRGFRFRHASRPRQGWNDQKQEGHRIPLTRELEAALLAHKPDDAKTTDSVFSKGVPRARTLKKDLEQVDIPFCDEQGRYADFHSLRYSWATHLQRQGVNSRMAMELMRHSDRKLTDKIYTDVNLLPLGETVRNLPAEEPLIHILTHISGKTCRNGSRVVATDQSSETTETSVTVGDRRGLSLSDDLESLVEVAGVEPACRDFSKTASTHVVALMFLSSVQEGTPTEPRLPSTV